MFLMTVLKIIITLKSHKLHRLNFGSRHAPDLKPFTIMQWNAEGLFPKKRTAERLKAKYIDKVCIQETQIGKDRRFSIINNSVTKKERSKGGVKFLHAME